MAMKIISIHIPEYKLEIEPNFLNIGEKVDRLIEKNFDDGKYILRAIGKDDHPLMSLEDLISAILKIGTDKYNPKRKSVVEDDFKDYNYDIQGELFEIKNGKILLEEKSTIHSLFGDVIYKFYKHAPLDRGYSIRIDLLLLYNANKLIRAKKINQNLKRVDPKFEKYLYKFENESNKKEALFGIIKILR